MKDENSFVLTTKSDLIAAFKEIVEELRGRAKDVLLTRAISSEEDMTSVEPADDLKEMEGMNLDLAYKLAQNGVVTMEDLAEQSVDELLGIEAMGEEQAAQLIMKAREPWFAEQSK